MREAITSVLWNEITLHSLLLCSLCVCIIHPISVLTWSYQSQMPYPLGNSTRTCGISWRSSWRLPTGKIVDWTCWNYRGDTPVVSRRKPRTRERRSRRTEVGRKGVTDLRFPSHRTSREQSPANVFTIRDIHYHTVINAISIPILSILIMKSMLTRYQFRSFSTSILRYILRKERPQLQPRLVYRLAIGRLARNHRDSITTHIGAIDDRERVRRVLTIRQFAR